MVSTLIEIYEQRYSNFVILYIKQNQRHISELSTVHFVCKNEDNKRLNKYFDVYADGEKFGKQIYC